MFEAEVKVAEPETVAFVTMHGAYAQIPEGYGRLYGWVAQHGMVPQGMPRAVYLTAPEEVPEEQSAWELWAPVAAQTPELPADDSGCGVKRCPEHLVASATHVGPYETIPETYEPLVQWIAGHGYEIAGPPEELYFSDPEEVPPSEYVTEVRFPVAKR